MMISFIVALIISVIALRIIFPIWSKERDERISRHEFMAEWNSKEITTFLFWLCSMLVFIVSIIGIVIYLFIQ